MDKKALFRAKLKEHDQKLNRRINSPLVRYNEFDQPVCRVCDIVLKSEAAWPAHEVSRKHHEAIKILKANAAGRSQVKDVKPEPTELPKSKPEHSTDFQNVKSEPSAGLHKPRSTSELPADFFDNPESKRPKTDLAQNQEKELVDAVKKSDELPGSITSQLTSVTSPLTLEPLHSKKKHGSSYNKEVKGALPEGFFDDKNADLRARGIQPIKLDVKDEYKEFEKLIQEDLKEVDDRLEEEEYDAAEMIEEAETLEQKASNEKLEMIRRKKIEMEAVRLVRRSKISEVKQVKVKESSSDDDSDDEDDFTVDWRAKHL